MILATEKPHLTLSVNDCPQWVDILARLWLALLAALAWLTCSQAKGEVYFLSRYDLAMRSLTPTYSRVGAVFLAAMLVFLWQDFLINLLYKGLGGLCVA